MTPETYKFRNLQDRNYDHYVTYASKRSEQLSFWETKRIRFFQIQFNTLRMILTRIPMILLLLRLLKVFTTKPTDSFSKETS